MTNEDLRIMHDRGDCLDVDYGSMAARRDAVRDGWGHPLTLIGNWPEYAATRARVIQPDIP